MVDKNDFVMEPGSFSNFSDEEVAKVLEEIGTNARAKYEETSKELLDVLGRNDPVRILASMGWRYFLAQASNTEHNWQAAQQHHLELLQAIAIKGLPPELPEKARLADIVQRVAYLLDANSLAFSQSRVQAPKLGVEEKVNNQTVALEQIRMTTQVVRGEFNSYQLDHYLRAIFERLDNRFAVVHGTTASALLDILQGLLRITERKLNEHKRRLHRVARSFKEKKAIKAYFSAFPEEIERRELIIADAKGVRPNLVRFFLMEEADRFLPSLFCFDESDISAVCPEGSDATAAIRLIEAWSMTFGELKGRPVEHLHLANPIWDRPFIRLKSGVFFWPSPASSFSFGFEMFERLIAADARLSKMYEKSRTVVLEDELGCLLEKYYRDGRVLQGVKHKSLLDKQQYENDAVVLIDRTALLFEAKSGKVSPEAKRGSNIRLKREIAKLMAEPAEQSKRLMNLLADTRCEHTFQTKNGEQMIDSRTIDRYIRVNITLNNIGALSSRWPLLADADLVEAEAIQIPTMSIGDLDTICEVLASQSNITHYLHRRQELEANSNYFADEHDLLAFYLETGFNIGETEFDGTQLMIFGISGELNASFKRKPQGQRRQHLPSMQRSKLFERIIYTLEERKQENWLDITYRLLNVAVPDQEIIERNIRPSVEKVRKSRSASMSWSAELSNGPPQRRQAIAFVWYRCSDSVDLQARLREHSERTMEKAGTEECLVVGIDITRPADPYSVIAILRKSVRDA